VSDNVFVLLKGVKRVKASKALYHFFRFQVNNVLLAIAFEVLRIWIIVVTGKDGTDLK